MCVGRSGLAWLACGPHLEVVHAVTGERLSAYCFSGGGEHPPCVHAARDFGWLKRSELSDYLRVYHSLMCFVIDQNEPLWVSGGRQLLRVISFLDNGDGAEEMSRVNSFYCFIFQGLDYWLAWRKRRAACYVFMTWDCPGWWKRWLYQGGWVGSASGLLCSHLVELLSCFECEFLECHIPGFRRYFEHQLSHWNIQKDWTVPGDERYVFKTNTHLSDFF